MHCLRFISADHKFTLLVLSLLSLFLITACASVEVTVIPSSVPQATSAGGLVTPRPPVGLDPTATVPPPVYRESSQPITLDNVTNIEYLGRLDITGRKSTFFDWDVSADGIQLVALNNDLLVEWNLVTGVTNFYTTRQDVNRVLYSVDREEIYAIDATGMTRIYRSITGEPLTTVRLHPAFNGIFDYNETNGYLAVAGEDGTVKVWDMQARESLVTMDVHDDIIINLSLSNDGRVLATTGTDGTIKLWSWETRTEIAVYDLQKSLAQKMVFSADDTLLAVATQNFVAMWDVTTGELDYVLQTGTDAANEVLAFSPDGMLLVTGGESGNMRLWDVATSNLTIELPEIGGNRVSAAFSIDSNLLVTTMLGQDASLWNLTNTTDNTVGRAPLDMPSNNLFGVEWSTDGYTLIFFDANGEIFIWGIPSADA